MELFAAAGIELPPAGGRGRRTPGALARTLRVPLFNYKVVEEARGLAAFAPTPEQAAAAADYARKASTRRQDDPFYAHFPDIKILVKDSATGRRHGDLIRYAGNDRLFQFWNISMRYAPTNDIDPRWTGLWKTQAETLVQDMGL
jgi:hypothetical protein